MLQVLLTHIFREHCLNEQDVVPPGHGPRPPGEYIDLLESLSHDPVLGRIVALPGPATQWKQVLDFVRRCNEAYRQGFDAAHAPFAGVLMDHRSDCFQERLRADAHRWCMTSSLTPLPYLRGYSPESEHDVLRRWYRRGYLHRALETEEEQGAVWIPCE